MASDLFLILDDNSDELTYSGTEWEISNRGQWYGGTSRSPKTGTGEPGSLGAFSVSFEGKSIAFYGVSPAAPASQTMTVSIDGSEPLVTGYGDMGLPSYRQWYQSPDLAEGMHNITIGQIDGTSLDFAIIGLGPETSINSQRAIVDDDSLSIQYSGGWRRSLNGFDAGTLPDGLPFRDGTHQTWNAGDSLSFSFTGSSIAVYGIFSWGNLGSFSATYNLDGNSQSQTYSTSTSSPEYVNKIGQASNFLFYSNDSINSGYHTLLMNISHCTNQSFILDYITYLPSFATLGKMPNVITTTTTAKTRSATTVTTDLKSNPPTTTSSNAKIKTPHKISTAAAIGGIVAGLSFIGLGCLVILYLKRHNKKSGKRGGKDYYEDPTRPPIRTIQRSTATTPTSVNSYRSISPFPYGYTVVTPIRPDSDGNLRQDKQEYERMARQSSRPRTRLSRNPGGRSLERSRASFELYDTSTTEHPTANQPSPSSGMLLPYLSFGPSRPSASAATRPELNVLGAEWVQPATDNTRIQAQTTLAPGQGTRSRSANDDLRHANIPHPRLTPVRRGFMSPPSSSGAVTTFHPPVGSSALLTMVDRNYSRQDIVLTPLRPLPCPTTDSSIFLQESPRVNARARTDPIGLSERPLTPVRRTFTDPPLTAPVVGTFSSPITGLFPRLSAILSRHSRSLRRDVPADVDEEDLDWELDSVPPAYDSLSPRRTRFSVSNPVTYRPLPASPPLS